MHCNKGKVSSFKPRIAYMLTYSRSIARDVWSAVYASYKIGQWKMWLTNTSGSLSQNREWSTNIASILSIVCRYGMLWWQREEYRIGWRNIGYQSLLPQLG